MNTSVILSLGYYSLSLLIMLSLPLLLTALLVGFTISLFQAVTSIQEQTLSAVPKMISVFLVIVLLGPWYLNNMLGFLKYVFSNIPVFMIR